VNERVTEEREFLANRVGRKAAGHTSGVPLVVRRIFDPEKRGFGGYAA